MKTNLNKKQLAALTILRARLSPEDKGHRGNELVRANLSQIRLYLETWVLPLLDAIESPSEHVPHLCIKSDLLRTAGEIERQRERGYMNYHGDSADMSARAAAILLKREKNGEKI